MTSAKIDRVLAVLAGQKPDHAPVSFWYHFESSCQYGSAAVEAHLAHLRRFDLDFLKVMSDNGYPDVGEISCIGDLDNIPIWTGMEPEFTRQVELVAALSKALRGEVLIATTVFNALAALRTLLKPADRRNVHRAFRKDAGESGEDRKLRAFLAEDRDAVARVLARVGESLARFVTRCLDAGADGIFLSVRDDWLDVPGSRESVYEAVVRSSDLHILSAASSARFNLLHVCGCAVDFGAFCQCPVHAINWADRASGPPVEAVRDRMNPAPCGGVDHVGALAHGSPLDCIDQVHDALVQAGNRPMLIAPGCTYEPALVPEENLKAVCAAARSH